MEIHKFNQLIDLTIAIANQSTNHFDTSDPNSDYQKMDNELTMLKMRLNKAELNIFMYGEVKMGKSTFVNALIGEDICPNADEVCTNAPSVIC